MARNVAREQGGVKPYWAEVVEGGIVTQTNGLDSEPLEHIRIIRICRIHEQLVRSNLLFLRSRTSFLRVRVRIWVAILLQTEIIRAPKAPVRLGIYEVLVWCEIL